MIRSVVLAAVLVASPAMAGVHATEVEARLGVLVGDWTVVGREATYRDTCDWFGDRSFVICTTRNSAKDSLDQAIVGYSEEVGHYTYYSFGNGGESNARIGFPSGERGLVLTTEQHQPAGVTRITTLLEPQADGRLRIREDRSVDGGQWSMTAEIFYVARRADD
jgi:hypothetical protein